MSKLLIFIIGVCLCTPVWGGVDFNGDADDILIESAVISGYPFTMFCWFTQADITQNNILMWVGDKDVSNNWYGLGLSEGGGNDGTVDIMSVTPAGFSTVHTTNTMANNSWNSACGIFTDSTDRNVYLNADIANKATSVTNRTVADIDRFGIGRDLDTTSSRAHAGKISEVYIWDIALTEAELTLLHNAGVKGFGLQIQPANLVGYWPLDDYPEGEGTISGYTFIDRSGNGNDGTGVDADNDSDTVAEEVLSYPPSVY